MNVFTSVEIKSSTEIIGCHGSYIILNKWLFNKTKKKTT